MNYELITIILTIVLSWGSLGWFMWSNFKDVQKDMAGLRERMAHLEGSMGVIKDLFQASLAGKTRN